MSNSYNNILEFFKKLYFTRKTIKLINPDYIIVQSENNAIFINLALVFIKIPIALFIFGQMFQFKNDLTKYIRNYFYLQTKTLTVNYLNDPNNLFAYSYQQETYKIYDNGIQSGWYLSVIE